MDEIADRTYETWVTYPIVMAIFSVIISILIGGALLIARLFFS